MTDKNHLTIPGSLEWCEPPARRDFDYDRGFCAGSAEVETIRLERDASLAREAALREELEESDAVVTKLSTLLAGVAIALRGPELELHRHGYNGLPELIVALQQRLTVAEQRAGDSFEIAAKWIDKRCDDYVNEHGSRDPETGTVEFPGNGEEYVGELTEIAEGLRALKPAEEGEGS